MPLPADRHQRAGPDTLPGALGVLFAAWVRSASGDYDLEYGGPERTVGRGAGRGCCSYRGHAEEIGRVVGGEIGDAWGVEFHLEWEGAVFFLSFGEKTDRGDHAEVSYIFSFHGKD